MCLTCFKCMLLIKHKMMLFRKVASARPVGWMTAGGALHWYQIFHWNNNFETINQLEGGLHFYILTSGSIGPKYCWYS
jgi:hypothetical protein